MLKESRSYSFNKSLKKIHRCLPALDGSILILYQLTLGKDSLMHVSANGECLSTHNFDDMVDTLTMPTERHALVLLIPKNQVFLIDLQNHQTKHLNFQYHIDISCQVKLQAFCQTKLVAIIENGAYNHPFLKIIYMKFPFEDVTKNEEITPCAEYKSQEAEWTYEYTIRKGNSHSMILWYRSRHDDEFQIKTFDLRTDSRKGTFRIIRLKNTLGQPYGIERINCALQEVWEMRPNYFCLVATTDKTEKKCLNSRQNIINNFIWDIQKGLIRQAGFQLPPKANSLQIDTFSSGRYCMFRSFAFEQGKPIDSPAIFVSNHSQQILANQQGKCTFQTHWEIPAYSDCMFAEGLFDNSGVTQLTMITRMILSRKEMCLYLLVQSDIQGMDKKLIKEVITLLA